MKYLLLLLAALNVSAQSLTFDKRNVECEDRWIAFQMGKDSSYMYGFIYIDFHAGLTFNYEGNFKIDDAGKFIPTKNDKNGMIKARLQPNHVAIALIPESKFAELEIASTPDWLALYKTDENSIEKLHRWGYFYNSFGESEKALSYLEQGQKIDPKYPGLAFELAFAYNALHRFKDALTIIEEALKHSPNECHLYKERAYSEIHLGKLDLAKKTYLKAVKLCTDKSILAEMSLNLAYQYFQKREYDTFDYWAKEIEKWVKENDMYSKNLQNMKKALNEIRNGS